MLEQIDHINIVVADLPRMVEFYRNALGLKVTKEVTIAGPWIEAVVGLRDVVADVVYLELDQGPRIELIAYRSPVGAAPAELDKPHTRGLRHVAFRVADIEAAVQRLRAAGVSLMGEPQQVPDQQVTYAGGVRKRLVYFHDPEGTLLELCEYRVA